MITLRQARKLKHLTQAQAAELLGVSIDTINRWETGKTSPPVRKAEKIMALYALGYYEIKWGENR